VRDIPEPPVVSSRGIIVSVEPKYFRNTAQLQRWFARNAGTADELVVGFMKSGSGQASITWPEAVDEALCVGWIDGVRHRIDDERYRIRFTSRKAGSNWSDVNIRRVAELEAQGRMTPAGLAAFARRTEARSRTASYEQAATPGFTAAQADRFKALPGAWQFYESLPPSYKKKVTWWVVSAKRQETRDKRLEQLIEACTRGQRL
jgi:uncharacterized protein YdeI (YjbR/CyaY-like superfamily)